MLIMTILWLSGWGQLDPICTAAGNTIILRQLTEQLIRYSARVSLVYFHEGGGEIALLHLGEEN